MLVVLSGTGVLASVKSADVGTGVWPVCLVAVAWQASGADSVSCELCHMLYLTYPGAELHV